MLYELALVDIETRASKISRQIQPVKGPIVSVEGGAQKMKGSSTKCVMGRVEQIASDPWIYAWHLVSADVDPGHGRP